MRKEDFIIGEYLYTRTESQEIKKYGASRLDSVAMIVNHDQLMGSLPSAVFDQLPSKRTYEFSLVYLLQRAYGSVLLMPHDIELDCVRQALRQKS